MKRKRWKCSLRFEWKTGLKCPKFPPWMSGPYCKIITKIEKGAYQANDVTDYSEVMRLKSIAPLFKYDDLLKFIILKNKYGV